MSQRATRRLRFVAAMTVAGVAGLSGGALPAVVASDDPSAVTTTTDTTSTCPTGTDTTPQASQDPATTTAQDACPVDPPTVGTDPQPPTTTTTTDATDPAPPPPATTTTTETQPAPHPAKPAASGPAHSQSSTVATPAPVASKPSADRTAREHRLTERRTHKRSADATPEHSSPYAPLTMRWTMPDPLGLDDFPKITVAEFPVPPFLLPIYQAAGAQYRIHWEILAAINEAETSFGANLRESSAGAVGWMQFMPSTWHRYGIDADGDGVADPWDPVDAIFAAARYLHYSGAERSLPDAIWAYNHAGWYVDRVIDRARTFAGLPDELVALLTRQGFADTASIKDKLGKDSYLEPDVKLTMPGQALLLDDHALRHTVLNDDKVNLYACGRQDLIDNRIDDRVLATLEYLRLYGFDPTVTALECGHSYLTTSGNVSEHSTGDAVDIGAVNNVSILGHQGPGSITDRVVRRLLALQGLMTPHQVITLMVYDGHDNTLALPDHANHVHVGFRPMANGQ